jgi:hypothetical protein
MPTALKRGEAAQQDVPEAPEGVQLATQEERTRGMEGSYGDEFEKFMYTTDRPDEPVTAGATGRTAPPPADIAAYISDLVEMSRQPGAPQELLEDLAKIRRLVGA